ncbi:transketolase-like protein 1 [Carcharodon carcharias]|uniref:transketolase-like protein 1 n=1 Tax=Carcharodon carcharias TaxID=13397 RepID=UPI001B7DB215|nr:transketolase-like protein 1 [Carcharodon carcharias]
MELLQDANLFLGTSDSLLTFKQTDLGPNLSHLKSINLHFHCFLAKIHELESNGLGICFIRTSRPETAVIYPSDEEFEVGRAKIVLQKETDSALVIGAGITLHEALAAADQLANEGINIRILDPFTIKPLDAATIIANAKAVGGRIITVEDHYREGGLGEAVSAAVCSEPGIVVRRLAVSGIAWSAKPAELLDAFGISAGAIVTAVRSALAN